MNVIKKIIKNEDNEILLMGLLISFLILVFKELISTYISSIVTLFPTIFIFLYFIIKLLKHSIKFKKYDYVFGIFLVFGLFSGFFHNQYPVAVIYQVKSLGIYYLLYMIVRNTKFKQIQIEYMVKIMNGVTLLLILFSLIEILSEKTFLFPKEWADSIVYSDNYIRSYSLICNPNLYAFYLLFVMIINFEFNKAKYSNKSLLIYILCILGIILSISRSAFICLLFVIFLFIFNFVKELKKNKENAKYICSIILVFLVPVFLSNLIYQFVNYNNIPIITSKGVNLQERLNIGSEASKPNRTTPKDPIDSNKEIENIVKDNVENNDAIEKQNFFTRMFDMVESKFVKESLGNGRLAVVAFGLENLKKDPIFGTGFSSFLTASSFLNPNSVVHNSNLKYSDNQYIAILVETGLCGMLICMVFIVMFIKDMVINNKKISLIATIIFLFFGMFINVLEVQLISFVYFVFIGLEKEKNNG